MKRQLSHLILVALSIIIGLVACVPTSTPSLDAPTAPPARMQVTATAEQIPPISTGIPVTPTTTLPPTATPLPPSPTSWPTTESVSITREAATSTSSPTSPAPTIAPISILEVLPRAGSEWSPITTVRVRFSGPMDQEKTSAAFSIEPHVPGNLEWHENNVLELHSITDRLLPHTTYTVTLATTAVDANGQPILTEPYTWTFTTARMEALSEFGSGSRVQLLSRDGRQAVQFAARQNSPEAITFDLARVSLDAWLHDNAWEGGEPVQSWHQTLIRPDWYSIPQETMLPGLPSGMYRLDMKVGRYVEDRLLLIISDLLLTVKEDAGHLLVWVQTADGRTLADADVTVYQAGTPVANGRTAADGTTLIPFTAAADDAAIIVVARHGEEIVAVQLNRSFGASSRARSSDRYQIGTYTDRPVYYPGDDVFFRTIIRWREDADPQMIPVGTAVVVSLEQLDTAKSRWQPVASQTLLSSHFGSVHGRFQLPQEPGDYRLNSAVEGHTHTTAFTVQPRSEAPFSVTVTTDAPIYAADEQMTVTVESHAADGQPVANAMVTISLLESGNTNGCFGAPRTQDNWFNSHRDTIHGRTDADGRITVTLPAEIGYFTHTDGRNPQVYHGMWAISAAVQQGVQTAYGFAVAEVANVANIVTLQVNDYLQTPEVAFPVTAALTTLKGDPVANRTLHLAVLAYDETGGDYATTRQTMTLKTGADGRATTNLAITHPGYYRLRLWGADAGGRVIEAITYVTVYDAGYKGSYGTDMFALAAAQNTHYPGQTARLIVRSGFSGPALLTITRGALYRYEVVQLTAPLTLLDLPLTEQDAPNVHVTLNAWQPQTAVFVSAPHDNVSWNSLPDYTLQTASLDLEVTNPAYVTDVVIETDKLAYAPGETAEITVRVTNGQGEGVSAEVGLALVDAAIYEHHSPHIGSLAAIFHNRQGNLVQTYHTMHPIRYLYGEGGGCGCGGGDWGDPGEPIADFNNSVIWNPTIVTDHNGEASFTITWPAAPGQWRLSTYAVTADTQVGETAVIFSTR